MDIYRCRQVIPAHWPEHIKNWATQCVLSGVVPTLTDTAGNLSPEFSADAALDLWFPLGRITMGDGEGAEDRKEILALPWEGRIIIAWPDGTVHIGISPRTLEDVPALYRHARIVLEHCHRATKTRNSSGAPRTTGAVH